jgi:O-antigen/teichoic acid export membrane protein
MGTTRRKLISGITYTAISKYAGMVISLIVTAILARLISPSDFGIVAIATVIITFFGMFSDLGIAPAIVQNKQLSETELADIFSFTVWIGIFISLCFFFVSWLIASYYGTPVLIGICQLLSIDLLFAAFNIVPYALLLKNQEFKFLASRNLIVQTIGGGISILAALNGAGLYALIINPIFSSVVLFYISFRKYPQKFKKGFHMDSIRKIYTFSSYQFLFNLINYFSRNLDKLMIGRYLSLSALGYYEKSYRLMMLPLQNITHVVTPAMHPVFSELQNDLRELSGSYLRVVRLLAFIGFPGSVFLWFASNELIILIFGNQWGQSVPVFQILSLTVGIQIILSTSGSIFQAANDTKNLFISGLLSAILTISAMFAGIFIFKKLEAVAWGLFISFLFNFIQCFVLMFKITFRQKMLPFWKQIGSPLILSVILAILFFIGSPFLENISKIIKLLIKGTFFILISGLYIQLSGEYNFFVKIRQLPGMTKKIFKIPNL